MPEGVGVMLPMMWKEGTMGYSALGRQARGSEAAALWRGGEWVEGANEVLPAGVVDPSLAAHRRVRHGHQGGRHLEKERGDWNEVTRMG